MQYHNNIIDLKKLRENLPYGYSIRLSDITGYSASFCRMVILGLRYNRMVIEAAVELAYTNKKIHQEIQDKIEAL
jgi:hypothetical protein